MDTPPGLLATDKPVFLVRMPFITFMAHSLTQPDRTMPAWAVALVKTCLRCGAILHEGAPSYYQGFIPGPRNDCRLVAS